MIVVTAATGNIGKVLVEALLERKQTVRAVSRNADKLARLAQKGAETVVADLEDAEAMRRAFLGATAVFTLIPPNPTAPDFRGYQRTVATAFAAAIRAANVAHVVNLSSVGGNLVRGTGPIGGLYECEQLLDAIDGLNVLHLRPGFFMENYVHNLGLIRGRGVNGSSLRGDLPINMVATRDVALVAAERLAARDFSGSSTQELLGPRAITPEDATRALGAAIGNASLPYVQFSYEEAKQGMIHAGVGTSYAGLIAEMNKSFNDGIIIALEARSPRNTSATTIDEFAKTFAAVYAGGGQH